MSPKRPPRAWIGEPRPVDPSELVGPRGLIREVLDEAPAASEPELTGPEAFYWDLLTEARKARIESVIAARLSSVTVVLDRLFDPHNTAAILRTSEGLGIGRVHVVANEDHDVASHRSVTQDAAKWLDLEVHPSGAVCVAALREKGFAVFAGHLDDRARLYTELPADRPLALLFGNEHEGPQPETLAACDGTFRIPMAGFTQSFNVSVAAGMALAHATRARRAVLGAPGDLPAEERVLLKRRYTLLAAKLARRLKNPPGSPSNLPSNQKDEP